MQCVSRKHFTYRIGFRMCTVRSPLCKSKKLLEPSKCTILSLSQREIARLGCFAIRFGLVLPNCVRLKEADLNVLIKPFRSSV